MSNLKSGIMRRFFLSNGLAMAMLLATPYAQAQVQPPPPGTPGILLEQQRRLEEQQKRQEQQLQPPAAPEIQKPPPPPLPKGTEQKVKVTQFKFSGNTVVETQTLEAIVADAVGKELTVRQLNEVADLVSEHYVGKGYLLARAYLPPQEIVGGVVEIAVVEGKVGEITIQGNQRYTSSAILRMMGPVRREGIIRESTLETALNELNDYTGLRVRADLTAGKTPGLTDINLTAKERIPHTFNADINNYGSRLTGPVVYSSEVGLGNLFGRGDYWTMKGSKSNTRLFLTALGTVFPVTDFGTELDIDWNHSENVVGHEFSRFRPTGRADIFSFEVDQTLTRTSVGSAILEPGFEAKTIRNLVQLPPGGSPTLQSKDEIRSFHVGLRGDFLDPWLGRTFYNVRGYYGVDFWGGSQQNAPQTSFAGRGPGKWSKLTLDLSRYQSLGFPSLRKIPVIGPVLSDGYLLVHPTGQVASDRLLAPERFAIGGYYSVRGYQIAERIGDNGYEVTTELVVPVPYSGKIPFSSVTWKDTVQVAAFIDNAGTFATPLKSVAQGGYGYLTGAGGGIRFNLPFGVPSPVDRGSLTLKIDWASAIGRPRPTSRDQGITIHPITGAGDAGVLYISLAARF